jgi:hypothetical protein
MFHLDPYLAGLNCAGSLNTASIPITAGDIPVALQMRLEPASNANSGLADLHGMRIASINIEEY